MDDGAAVFVVEAAVDVVCGAVDDCYEGGCGFFFAGDGAEGGGLVFFEVEVFVSEVVEAAEGSVAA